MKRITIYLSVIVSIFLLNFPCYGENLIYIQTKGADSDIKCYIYSIFPNDSIVLKKKNATHILTIDIDAKKTSSGNIYISSQHASGGTRYYNYEATISYTLENLTSTIVLTGSVSGSSVNFSPYVTARFRYISGKYTKNNNYNNCRDNSIQDALQQLESHISKIVSCVNNQDNNNSQQESYTNDSNAHTSNTYEVGNIVPYQETIDLSDLSNNSDINLTSPVKIYSNNVYEIKYYIGSKIRHKEYYNGDLKNIELLIDPDEVFDDNHPNDRKIKIIIDTRNNKTITKIFHCIR